MAGVVPVSMSSGNGLLGRFLGGQRHRRPVVELHWELESDWNSHHLQDVSSVTLQFSFAGLDFHWETALTLMFIPRAAAGHRQRGGCAGQSGSIHFDWGVAYNFGGAGEQLHHYGRSGTRRR